ncbi:DMT family transporter [Nemorincola caseinilytica]|uniref:DMT family transporter n=1 Tax=Nemorincola caseinilytica TaxID=2054315 RepID=A0ABP8NDA7_9BACT
MKLWKDNRHARYTYKYLRGAFQHAFSSMANDKAGGKLLIIGMVISMFLWGLSWPSGKVLSGYCSVVNFTVYRYVIVVITTAMLLPIMGISFRLRKQGIPVFIASGVLLAVYSYFFFMGIKKGTAGAGGVLVTTMNPIMAYMLGIALSRRLPSRNEGIGLLLGIAAGITLLKLWDSTAALLDSGNLYFLMAALTWAVMSKFTARGAQYGTSLSFSLWQYMVTLLCFLPFTDVAEMQATLQTANLRFWGNLIFSSAIVTSGATTIYFYTTTRLGAEKASSFIFLVPLAAAISSWLLLGEKLQVHTMAGGILGIAAVYIMNKKRKTQP